MTDPRIIVAIDTYDLQEANLILDQLDPDLCKIKIGSVVFNSLGKSFLKEVSSRGFKIFLDLKLHDIPNTVHEAILGFHDCSIDMLTVHLSGGEEMLKKAMLAGKSINTKVIGVSILTSLEESDTLSLFNNKLDHQIRNLFEIAVKANLDGVVCSPHELEMSNTILNSDSIKITPGIRDIKVEDDQARTMNAKEAIEQGATFLVIGRPITQAQDISTALKTFSDSIEK
ncbi:orotidine-5'-phosphate decarboxylase [Gammaproteobacteria bacterium]|nr:orotidine-5'-phosphate decarboxylase [Gammaproteobacteria bacterium]MDC0387266.1 orotidine-5'-phosphate decarboxylase [Gammaproteobacteria bacterium]